MVFLGIIILIYFTQHVYLDHYKKYYFPELLIPVLYE
jgi:hypothetical protein